MIKDAYSFHHGKHPSKTWLEEMTNYNIQQKRTFNKCISIVNLSRTLKPKKATSVKFPKKCARPVKAILKSSIYKAEKKMTLKNTPRRNRKKIQTADLGEECQNNESSLLKYQ